MCLSKVIKFGTNVLFLNLNAKVRVRFKSNKCKLSKTVT